MNNDRRNKLYTLYGLEYSEKLKILNESVN